MDGCLLVLLISVHRSSDQFDHVAIGRLSNHMTVPWVAQVTASLDDESYHIQILRTCYSQPFISTP